ncbi:uncharacterized protein LOC143252427 isoform X3 [Tachypleus tridentatus]|uniref:uncharacterized protein LOC143252427 isoform X3 n=1 Tax=Tachypleus tridentatus TaxID=6853 RepID=UPI003FD30AF8
MGNACLRSATYSPAVYIESARMRKSASVSPSRNSLSHDSASVFTAGDDCAINELLEGWMEIDVFLPDGRKIRTTVERRTPMMDLLVQVTTTNKISPTGHVIQILTDRGKIIQYKPNTPIGSLDSTVIYIVPKSSVLEPAVTKIPIKRTQPFEQTFRLQVKLPKNQLTVLRVSPKMTLAEVKKIICEDKSLDSSNYQLVRPSQPNIVLDMDITLAVYGSTEIALLSNGSIKRNIQSSTTDLISYSTGEDDTKQGIVGLLTRETSKGSLASSSSEDASSQGDSPRHGNYENQLMRNAVTMKPSIKKRPAPRPPLQRLNGRTGKCDKPELDKEVKNVDGCLPVSHSRHSSDSSGYHEASVFSDLPENASPETCCSSSGLGSLDSPVHIVDPQCKKNFELKNLNSQKWTNLSTTYMASTSNNSLTTAGKKRKAPLPPGYKKDVGKLQLEPVNETIDKNKISDFHIDLQLEVNKDSNTFPQYVDIANEPAFIATRQEVPIPEPPQVQPFDPATVLALPFDTSDLPLHPPTPPPEFADVIDECTIEESQNTYQYAARVTVSSLSLEEDIFEDSHHHRHSSVSSVSTIRDIENSFKETIKEGENALEKEKEFLDQMESITSKEETINSEMMTCIGQLNQNVTNQLIPSPIEAKFSAVEKEAQDIIPISNELHASDSFLGPPSPFQEEHGIESNSQLDEDTTDKIGTESTCLLSHESVKHVDGYCAESVCLSSQESVADVDGYFAEPVYLSSQESLADVNGYFADFTCLVSHESAAVDDGCYAEKTASIKRIPQDNQKPALINFSIGAYKKQEEDIYTHITAEKSGNLPEFQGGPQLIQAEVDIDQEIQKETRNRMLKRQVETFTSKMSETPNDKQINNDLSTHIKKTSKSHLQPILCDEEGSVQGLKGQVRLNCSQLSDIESSPLTGRSTSMLNLVLYPTSKLGHQHTHQNIHPGSSANLRRVQSDRDICNAVSDLNSTSENQDLQAKYKLLKEQFVLWREQLARNQTVLQSGETGTKVCISPLYQTSLNNKNTRNQGNATLFVEPQKHCKDKPSENYVSMIKTRQSSLPERQQRPKTQILTNVTIGSWQQRNHKEGSKKSNFHTTENVVHSQSKLEPFTTQAEVTVSSSTVTTNVPKCSTRQSEKTTKSGIKISTEGRNSQLSSKSASVYQTGKYEKNTSGSQTSMLDYQTSHREPRITKVNINTSKPGVTYTYFGAPVVRGFSEDTVQNLLNGGSAEEHIIEKKECQSSSVETKHTKCLITNHKDKTKINRVNSNVLKIDCTARSLKESNDLINGHQNIPPPPPLSLASSNKSLSTFTLPEKHLDSKNKCKEKATYISDIDPRDKLLIDIRNFGGRGGLRTVPVTNINWQLRVFGSTSSSSFSH